MTQTIFNYETNREDRDISTALRIENQKRVFGTESNDTLSYLKYCKCRFEQFLLYRTAVE
jgi:hypothetical protein